MLAHAYWSWKLSSHQLSCAHPCFQLPKSMENLIFHVSQCPRSMGSIRKINEIMIFYWNQWKSIHFLDKGFLDMLFLENTRKTYNFGAPLRGFFNRKIDSFIKKHKPPMLPNVGPWHTEGVANRRFYIVLWNLVKRGISLYSVSYIWCGWAPSWWAHAGFSMKFYWFYMAPKAPTL